MSELGEDASCIPEGPRIIAVHILDGEDEKYLSGDRIQWVNFPRDAKWVDESLGVRNEDRLGQKLRVKVQFDEPGAHDFTLELVPSDGNEPYTGDEEGRNPNFLYEKDKKSYTTEANGEKIIKDVFFITCQGGDVFTLLAKDNCDNEVSSMEVEAKRFFYVVEVKMDQAPCASNLRPVQAKFALHGIKVEPLPSTTMPHIENLDTDEEFDHFKAQAKTAYSGSEGPAKQPYALCVAYTDHLAVKQSDQEATVENVPVGPHVPQQSVTIPLVDGYGKTHSLWRKIVTGESWFLSAEYEDDFEGLTVPIPESAITPAGGGNSPDDHRQIAVDVSALPDGVGTITVKLNWVERMRGGRAFRNSNLVAVCTRGYWRPIPDATQHLIIVHELGHRLGMVVDGTGKYPDKPQYHYTGRNHRGPHCYNGVALRERFTRNDTASAQCVMFGSVSGNISFCDECAPAVKKVDISEGWDPV